MGHLGRWQRAMRAGFISLIFSLGLQFAHADTWSIAADLANARHEHTATLLTSGDVLVVGGRSDAAAYVKNAEIYNVDRNTWTLAQAPIVARANHTATLLASGKVLVVGGQDASGYLASAELYDPVSNTWSSAGNLASTRARHTATLLISGKVLVVGGTIADGVVDSTELYDPATNVWSSASSPATPRYDHTASLLPSGEVLVAAGFNASTSAIASTETYDPVANAWRNGGSLAVARYSHTVTLLASGALLAVGGANSGSGAEKYSPATDTWDNATSPAHVRTFHTATLLPTGNIFVTGGVQNGDFVSSSELYDSTSDSWTIAASPHAARSLHTATLLPSGKVLVAGGHSSGGSLASTEIYDQANDAWAMAGNLVTRHGNNHMTLLPSGNALLIAGSRDGFASATAEQYDTVTNLWSAAGSLRKARVSATVTLLSTGKILVAGGYTGSVYLGSVELYDPLHHTSEFTGNLATAREYHTATLLPSGNVLVAGGFNGFNGGDGYLASVEIYNPISGAWTLAANLTAARGMHTATLLPSGKVLIVGGTNNGIDGVLSAELYDPVSDSWSPAGQPSLGRYFHTATLLASGRVIVAGGRGPAYRTNTELYDPDTNTWHYAGSIANMRYSHAAALLPTGEVLIVGGSDNNPIASTERYDPASNTWSLAGSLSAPRRNPSAITLPAGDILVAGGSNNSQREGLSITERYSRHIGIDESRRPLVATASEAFLPGDMLELSGNGFTGDSEAAGGGTQSSVTNSPLVQLRRIDNDQILWTSPDPNSDRSPTSYRSAPLHGLPGGHYALTLSVNAIPSVSRVIEIPATHTVVPYTSGAGEIVPQTRQFVVNSATRDFTLTPEAHHHIAGVSGSCGGTLDGALFTTGPIVSDCTVIANFAIDTVSLMYSPNANGTIAGESPQTVTYGGSGTPVFAEPDIGYSFLQWSDASIANPRTDIDVTADVNVSASFIINTYKLTYAASVGGSVSGILEQNVEHGASGTPVTAISADEHQFIQWSDGSKSNPRTDEKVEEAVSVTALFAVETFTVTASANGKGAISPPAQNVNYGRTAEFTVTPDVGYIAMVSGDTCQVEQASTLSWTSSPITANCAVSATFAPQPKPVLMIDVTDSREYAHYGSVLEYIVKVTNIGTSDAASVTLSSILPVQIDASRTTWMCTGAGGGAKCDASGSGALNTGGAVIPIGRTLVWRVTAAVLHDATGETVDYSIRASLGNKADVIATDTDTLVIFRSEFELND